MFWGLTIEPGKHYTQTVEESFHVSMVALDTRDVATTEREQAKMTQLMVQHDKAEFLVCTLCFGSVLQQPLDLNFTEGEEVTFFSEGRGTLHLTGYLVKDEPLTLDPDMMSLEELSSLDGMASDSEGWASGEESSLDDKVRVQRSRRALKRKYASFLSARRRHFDLALYKQHLRQANACTKFPWRKRRKLSRKRTSSLPTHLGSDDEDFSVPMGKLRASRWLSPAPEQQVVLRTSDNVRATLTLSEIPQTAPKMMPRTGRHRENLVLAGNQGGATWSQAHDAQRRHAQAQYTLQSSTRNLEEPEDVMMVRNSRDGEQSNPRSRKIRNLAEKVSLLKTNSNSLVRDYAAGRNMTPSRGFSHQVPMHVQRSELQSSESATSGKHATHAAPSDSSAKTDSHQVEDDSVSPTKGRSRKRQLKNKPGMARQPKRMLSTGFVLPHKKMFQRKVNPRGRARRPGVQWNETLPSGTASVVDQEAAQMTGSHFDDVSLGQGLTEEQGQHPSDYADASGQQPGVSFTNQEQRCPPVGMIPQPRHTSTVNDQPGPGEPLEQYLMDSKQGLVPTSLAMAAGAGMDTSSPPVPGVGGSSGQTMAVRDTSGVYWSCLSDEQAEMGQGDAERFALNAGSSIPVATDMDFLTAEDMSCNGVNIGNQKIRLSHGYDVFVTRFDLWQAEKSSSKKGWTILTRRLLDIFFDRMTLAMGKPTHHGNSMEYIPLDQNVVGAIISFIKARYNITEKRKLIQAISIYCSDCRKSGVPGHLI